MPSTGTGGGTGGGGGGGGGGVLITQPNPERILVLFGFVVSKSTSKFTKFSLLQVKAIPIASTLTVTCTPPKGKKCPAKRFRKENAFGTVNLKKWVGKKLAAGTKLTATVTKNGNYIGAAKILTVRKRRAPKISTRCIPPGDQHSVAC